MLLLNTVKKNITLPGVHCTLICDTTVHVICIFVVKRKATSHLHPCSWVKWLAIHHAVILYICYFYTPWNKCLSFWYFYLGELRIWYFCKLQMSKEIDFSLGDHLSQVIWYITDCVKNPKQGSYVPGFAEASRWQNISSLKRSISALHSFKQTNISAKTPQIHGFIFKSSFSSAVPLKSLKS